MARFRFRFREGPDATHECDDWEDAARYGHGGREVIAVELLPEPPKPKHVVYVPTGGPPKIAQWYPGALGEMVARTGDCDAAHNHIDGYLRREVDLRETVARVLRQLEWNHDEEDVDFIVRAIEEGR